MTIVHSRQRRLPFPPPDPRCTLDNFESGERNAAPLAAVRQLLTLPGASLTLWGESGTGKSHLLQAFCTHLGEEAAYLAPAALFSPHDPDPEGSLTHFLAFLTQKRVVALDDLHQVAGLPLVAEGLLYLFNHFRSSGKQRLLLASRTAPGALPHLRPDLRTRLLWGPVLELSPPDDDALAAILQKLARDREVLLPPEVALFLVRRLPRQVSELAHALDRLDQSGLEWKRALTIPLAKEVLRL